MSTATTQQAGKVFSLPTIPVTPVDLINRRAAATGSPGYAMATTYGDYNGHAVRVDYRPHSVRGAQWVCEYYWGGRVVLGRGSLESCLRAAKDEHARGARGTSVRVLLGDPLCPMPLEEQIRACEAAGFTEGNGDQEWTATHAAVSDALHWERDFPGLVQVALKFNGTPEEWAAVRAAWVGTVVGARQ